MKPVIDQVGAQAYTPYGAGQITIEEAVSRSGTVLHGFMIRQTRETDLQHVRRAWRASSASRAPEAVPFSILLPAFIT